MGHIKAPVISRRRFLRQGALGGIGGILLAQRAPAFVASDATRPMAEWGLQIGDVLADRAIVWSRASKAARMYVEWSRDEQFTKATRIRGPHALDVTDFTSRLELTGLPPNSEVFVRVTYEDLDSGRAKSEPLIGRFRTAPTTRRNVRVLWSGDTCGQGFGINPDIGGMRIFEAMRKAQPDFFVHSGDVVYADGPMQDRMTDNDGREWRNAFLDAVPEKRKIAESLHDYRRNHLYNFYDENLRRFAAEVPQVWQWDDHDVTNNWSDSKELDTRYTERSIQALAARASRAFHEYAPMRGAGPEESDRVYRRIPYGPDLEVFVLDMRSYRGHNTFNRQERFDSTSAILGDAQFAWLTASLSKSRATWKVIAADLPLALLVEDGTDAQGRKRFEGPANGDGPPLGREHEMANLLRFIKRQKIGNVVWITADVHYCAAHHYDPNRAQFQDFTPFWEFVTGPLNAANFGPASLDNTFGPKVMFQKAPPKLGTSPLSGDQFFGQLDVDAQSRTLTVSLKDMTGATMFTQRLNGH